MSSSSGHSLCFPFHINGLFLVTWLFVSIRKSQHVLLIRSLLDGDLPCTYGFFEISVQPMRVYRAREFHMVHILPKNNDRNILHFYFVDFFEFFTIMPIFWISVDCHLPS